MNTMNTRETIYAYAVKYQGDWTRIGQALRDKESVSPPPESPIPYVTLVDPDYPDCFRSLRYPPWILFFRGDLSLASRDCAGIIGSRRCTSQALENTKTVTEGLMDRYVIVSGLARGIDAAAHETALKAHTIGIIGCGLDRVYPKENAPLYKAMGQSHLLLSEYPPATPPLAKHFPWRNRLIAACCKFVVIPEAEIRSGTMHTVNACLELSKTVYCLPSPFGQTHHSGGSWLISQGAQILFETAQLKEL